MFLRIPEHATNRTKHSQWVILGLQQQPTLCEHSNCSQPAQNNQDSFWTWATFTIHAHI